MNQRIKPKWDGEMRRSGIRWMDYEVNKKTAENSRAPPLQRYKWLQKEYGYRCVNTKKKIGVQLNSQKQGIYKQAGRV